MNLTTQLTKSKIFRTFTALLIPGLSLTGIIWIQCFGPGSQSLTPDSVSQGNDEAFVQAANNSQQQQTLQLQLLKILPTLGYDNLLADWTFLRFLQYFGDEPARTVTDYQLNDDYFDVISQLDPRWLEMYLFLSTSISFYQGQPQVAVELMKRGTNALSPEINPRAWIIWRLKAIDQLLLVGDTLGAVQSLYKAAEWAENSPDKNLAPQFRQAAAALQQNQDHQQVRFNAWLSVYYQTTDALVRERATQELLNLGATINTGENGEIQFILPLAPSETRTD